MDITYHYPPELFQLLVDAIPRLCRAKKDVLLFFRGAGVETRIYSDLERKLAVDPNEVNKFGMTRAVLSRLNEAGEATLRERREVLKRVVEFEDFSTCWPDDQLEAKGLVAQIHKVINVKDSFTRMRQEREAELAKHRKAREEEARVKEKRRDRLRGIRQEFFRLFGHDDAQERGKLLEVVLNRLFKEYGISVREAFSRVANLGEGIVEQIDGVIELDGEIYLVEMKWLKVKSDVNDVSRHLVRVFTRDATRGIFISYSDYTPAAIQTCREALAKAVIVLCKLDEIVALLNEERDLREFLKAKVRRAVLDKEPMANIEV